MEGSLFTRVILLAIGYVCGLAENGYYYGRIKGIDIRQKGSGNIGATNSLRVFGPKIGALILLLDFLKAFIPCMIVGSIWKEAPLHYLYVMYTGVGVILGHNFPAQLKLKGGKGVASSAGLLFAMDWKLAVILVAVFAIIAISTRLVSLASITVMMLFIIAVLLFANVGMEFNILAIIVGCMSIIRHASNIERLLKGTEKKI